MITRREFLDTMAVGAAGLAVGSTAKSYAQILGANDRLNFAVIGLHSRGYAHLSALAANSKTSRIAWICDVESNFMDKFGAEAQKELGYAPKTEGDFRRILERKDIDAISIATPDHWHAPIALAAIAAGKDVYLEKPMTHTLDEARQVFERARDSKRIVQVGVQGTSWTRWHKVREMVESGMLGQVVAAQGTYSRNNPDGDWNWDIDPEAGPQGKGDNYIDWQQWIGAAPGRAFDADRFFRFRKYWDY